MADIIPVRVDNKSSESLRIWKWETLTEDDVALPIQIPLHSDMTFMITGDFGGGDVSLEGTIDPEAGAYLVLSDTEGADIVVADDDILSVMENVYLMRPGVPTGTGADLDVWIMARG
jgi:hypothetical protein